MTVEANGLTDIANFIGKADLQRMPDIVAVFDKFSAFYCHVQGGTICDNIIDFFKQLNAWLCSVPTTFLGWRTEILDGSPFFHKFGIVADKEFFS